MASKCEKKERNDFLLKILEDKTKSLRDVAKLFGISRQRVHQILKQRGIEKKEFIPTPEYKQKISELVKEGLRKTKRKRPTKPIKYNPLKD